MPRIRNAQESDLFFAPSNSTRKLFVHVGGPKTGSSAIQSWLAKNRDYLRNNGLTYQESTNDSEALEGRISSGNGAALARDPSEFELHPGHLWSSEHLFHSGSLREKLSKEADNAEFLIVVCGYFRDPVEWAVSSWMQGLKRNGSFSSLDDFISSYKFRREKSLLEWLEFSQQTNVEVRFANYSRHKNSIVMHFLTQLLELNIQEISGVVKTCQLRVNRSLTAGEIDLMIALNRETGGDRAVSKLISDSLVEQLPFLPSNPPSISGGGICGI